MPNILDIIIPIYNTPESFLVPCLSSINRQKFMDFKKLGVIIVDNASKEIKYKKSWFKQRFPKLQITFIVNEKNLGPGLSRQVGLDHSEAKYITFLDSDDEIYGNSSLAKVVSTIENVDVNRLHTAYFEETPNEFGSLSLIRHNENSLKCLHAHYFNRSFLQKYNIRFHEKLIKHEDVYFLSNCVGLSGNSWAYLDVETYVWKWNNNSVVRGRKELFYGLEDFFTAFIDSLRFLRSNGMINKEKIKSNFFGLYTLLDSNLFDLEEYKEKKDELEKQYYNCYKENIDVLSALSDEEIDAVTEIVYNSHTRSYPWLVLKSNYKEYMKNLLAKYEKNRL